MHIGPRARVIQANPLLLLLLLLLRSRRRRQGRRGACKGGVTG